MATPKPLDYARPAAGHDGVWNVCVRLLTSRWARRSAVVGIGLVAAGYLSDYASRSACERRTARLIAAGPMAGRPFFVELQNGAEAARIFSDAGVTILPGTPNAQANFPWGDVGKSHMTAPFLVDVDTGWAVAPLAGEGGTHRYLCLFGMTIDLGNRVTWVS
jgi:hypothetical protein